MTEKADVAVVGAGPAGYVAAIRCAQLGLDTVCIDDWSREDGSPSPGGTCLNVGCIPSKALLDSSEQFHRLTHSFAAHGITTGEASMDVPTMIKRKEKIVKDLTSGIGMLFKANKVRFVHGRGRLLPDNQVQVVPVDGSTDTKLIAAGQVILAAGSVPTQLPGIEIDGRIVVDSSGALAFDAVPPRLGIIGAGVIGLELGSVWRRLGSEVVLLEAMDDFMATADRQVAREAARQFKKQGLDIQLGAMVNGVETSGETCQVTYTKGGNEHTVEFDRLIVAVGRRPLSDGLLDPACGVAVDKRGFIEVDDHCRTAVDGVWAIGDVVRGPMLAHKGSEEGVAVAERIAGGHGHIDFNTVPWVVYTSPEIAWVGQTEESLKNDNIPFRSGSFSFAATGRAKAMEEPVGFVKVIAHADNDRILGVHMIGPHVSELIAECVVAMEFEGNAEDLASIIHAHPTLSEAVHEAALSVGKRAIHKANK